MPYRKSSRDLGPSPTAVERGDLSAVLPPDCAESCHAHALSPQGRVATPVVVGMGDGGGHLDRRERRVRARYMTNGRAAA